MGEYEILDRELNKIRALSCFKNNLVEHLIRYFKSHQIYHQGKLKYIKTQMYNHFPNWFFDLNNKGLISNFIPKSQLDVQINLDYIFQENNIPKKNDFDTKLLTFNPKFINQTLKTSKIIHTNHTHLIKHHLVTNLGIWNLLTITKSQYLNLISRYSGPPELLNQYIMILLLRYKFLGGLNNHLSIPPTVYNKLKIDHELFGSPFNVKVNQYSSAFPDVETYFGSSGPFNTISLKSGKIYGVNPPYDVKVIETMSRWLVGKLGRDDVNDVVIYLTIPLWRNDFPGYQILEDSKYFHEVSELNKDDYKFYHYFRGKLISATDIYLIVLRKGNPKNVVGVDQIRNIWPR